MPHENNRKILASLPQRDEDILSPFLGFLFAVFFLRSNILLFHPICFSTFQFGFFLSEGVFPRLYKIFQIVRATSNQKVLDKGVFYNSVQNLYNRYRLDRVAADYSSLTVSNL